jgi:hypothetical protein
MRLFLSCVALLSAASRSFAGDSSLTDDLDEPALVQADGKPIEDPTSVGHFAPLVVDWDGDGRQDLLVGQFGQGALRIYRNVGEKGKPKLEACTWFEAGGQRAKPWVADWDEDGRPDLLVGDFAMLKVPEPELSEEQKAEKKELEKRRNEVGVRQMELYRVAEKAVREKMGLPEAGDIPAGRSEEYQKLVGEAWQKDKELAKLAEESQAIWKKMEGLQAKHESTGFVWLYRRK